MAPSRSELARNLDADTQVIQNRGNPGWVAVGKTDLNLALRGVREQPTANWPSKHPSRARAPHKLGEMTRWGGL